MTLPQNSQRALLPPLAITMGDPAGIGPDLILKIWQQRQIFKVPSFCLIACPAMLRQRIETLQLDIPLQEVENIGQASACFDQALPVLPMACEKTVKPSIADSHNAASIIGSIEMAVRLVQNGEASAVVTNPINKEVLYDAGFRFPGHTEFLASLANNKGSETFFPVMMLASDQLKVVPVTIHIALSKVKETLTEALLIKNCVITNEALKDYFGLSKPKIAIAGMNPHAGEGGSMGMTERDLIIPAIKKMRAQGLDVSGPHPADTLFHEEARKNYDVVMGMYHDQVLIPIKTLAFDEGVNVTLGLPFIRTSPDHGTAYDIAGSGRANPRSLVEAILLADKMAQAKLLLADNT